MANGQVSGQVDPVSEIKIYKGAIIALTGGIAVLVLLLAFGLGVDKATLTAFLAWGVPTGVNAIKEYYAGE